MTRKHTRRPDVLRSVVGLPLVVVEIKNAVYDLIHPQSVAMLESTP